MTTITIERAVIHRALSALEYHTQQTRPIHNTELVIEELKSALSAPATAPEQMPSERNCVCDPYVHLDGYSGGAAKEGLYGALWVVAEGVRKKYVLADQVSEPKAMPVPATTPEQKRPINCGTGHCSCIECVMPDGPLYQPATAPEQPAWHDAPTCAGLWLCDEGRENPYCFTTHRVTWPLNSMLLGEGERWFGPIPEDKP